MFQIIALISMMFVGCSALTVTQAPADTAVLIGRNATIACIVTNKASSESVQWKFRSNGSSTFNPVTFDSNILGSATKYAIQTVYNLTIITAATSDEGVYRCTAGTTDYDAKLTVVDLPSSVSLTLNGAANAGTTVNLTCTANNGRPTPNLRWLINDVERTSAAILQTGSVSATGYGNSVSNLPLALTSDMDGQLVVCYVAYDGWNDAMNATLVLDINGSAAVRMSAVLVVLGTLLSLV